MLLRRIHTAACMSDGDVCACGDQGSFDPTIFCSTVILGGFKACRRPSVGSIFGIQDLDHARMLFNSALLLCLIHVYRFSPRYVVTCLHYRYPPRSTEHIPLVICPALQILSLYRCRYSPSSPPSVVHVISVSQVILSLSSCRCLSSSSSSTSTSRISIKPHMRSA